MQEGITWEKANEQFSEKNAGNSREQMITVTTTVLKERLNRLYESRLKKSAGPHSFEHLWDLKELALLEGKSSVDVPRTWLDELDVALEQGNRSAHQS